MAKLGVGKRKMAAVRKKQSKQAQKTVDSFFKLLTPKKKKKKFKLF